MAGEKLIVTEKNGVQIIEIAPQFSTIDESVVYDITDELTKLAEGNAGKFVLDLKNVEFFGSSFIEGIFRFWKKINGHPDAGFAICHVNNYCQQIFDITNLNQLWAMYPTRDEAIQALNS